MTVSYRQLPAWKRTHALVHAIYHATKNFPDDEIEGITLELRKTAINISGKLANGFGRGSRQEFARFVKIALDKLNRVETLLEVAHGLGYLEGDAKLELEWHAGETRAALMRLLGELLYPKPRRRNKSGDAS
jgi:four helix bundle protein